MCMYVTDIKRDIYRVFVWYGYQDGELSCVFMLRISGGRAVMCMYATGIRRESYHVFVRYRYQEGELACVCILRI